MYQLESRFLRFGGSSWKSKIDPKRLREKIKKQQRKRKKQKRPNNKHQEAKRRPKNNVFDLKKLVPQSPGGMRRAAGEDYRRGMNRI